MYSISVDSIFQSHSRTQCFTKYLQLSETELQATIRLEESTGQQYKIRLKEGFLLVYPLADQDQGQLGCITLDFNIKMSRIYKDSEILAKAQPLSQGIKLQNQKSQSASFFFKSPNQTLLWIKKLSLYVNQLHFQSLYKPIRQLGKGATASVYQIRRIQDGKKFAAKIFFKEKLSKRSELLQNLKKEVDILRVINDQRILKFQGVFQSQQAYILVMELIKGMNIYEFLLLKKQNLQIQQIRTIMRSIMMNLADLQQLDVIHRDIKLENIVIDSNSLKTKIIDYGLAVYAEEEDYITYNCGTPGYLSPQVVNNNRDKMSTKSDVFSAGVVFYVLLTGKYLFNAKDPKQMLIKNMQMQFDLSSVKSMLIDKSAIDLLQKVLSLNPENRFSATQSLNHEFLREECQQGQDQKPNTPSTLGDNKQTYQF